MSIQVNLWAILVASVANLLIGALWYSPLLFGRRWNRLSGVRAINLDSLRRPDQVSFFVGVYFTGLILAAILAVVISVASIQTIWETLILCVMVWLGFTAAPTFAVTVFEGRSFSLWGINAGYPALAIAVMGTILIQWR